MKCSICGTAESPLRLRDAHTWRFWQREDGACPACVQESLLRTLLENGDDALHHAVQAVWPLDAESAFGALPTPIRLHSHSRFRGRGVTIALIDSGFAPHPDLIRPYNRIRAWVDAAEEPVNARMFAPDETPGWPASDQAYDSMWHGTMTSVVAAGNGFLSHGLYRGLASEAEVVLICARNHDGSITNATITRALDWLHEHGPGLGVGVVNLSVAGDGLGSDHADPVDDSIRRLVGLGMVVVAAAGNEGVRHLVPPASSIHAITVGGIDDRNMFDHRAVQLWHSNYGAVDGAIPKPELVAPSLWVAAPVLPNSTIARRAGELFGLRRKGNRNFDMELESLKLITEHYQHVEGTSFAAPIVASTVACMLEANARLSPRLIRDLLRRTAVLVDGAPVERQGSGVLHAGRAVAAAASEPHNTIAESPERHLDGIEFHLHDHSARVVRVMGSWNGWREPGIALTECARGWWRSGVQTLPKGSHAYKFLIDDAIWLDDPGNAWKQLDGLGGYNAVVEW